MELTTQGLHHVTMVSANAQRTLDFYRNVLGLGLVKRTVNFDDPGSYHLYFGDAVGNPGTLLTFFEWSHAHPKTAVPVWLGLGTASRDRWHLARVAIRRVV